MVLSTPKNGRDGRRKKRISFRIVRYVLLITIILTFLSLVGLTFIHLPNYSSEMSSYQVSLEHRMNEFIQMKRKATDDKDTADGTTATKEEPSLVSKIAPVNLQRNLSEGGTNNNANNNNGEVVWRTTHPATCSEKTRKDDVLEVRYVSRLNSHTGVEYESVKDENYSMKPLGSASETSILGRLQTGLYDMCPGESRQVEFGPVTLPDHPKVNLYWTVTLAGIKRPGEVRPQQQQQNKKSSSITTQQTQSQPQQISGMVPKKRIIRGMTETQKHHIIESIQFLNTSSSLENGWRNYSHNRSIHKVMKYHDLQNASKVIHGRRLPMKPAVQYLGVLLDGGRHYFPLDWMKRMVDHLHMLRFNFIHFRLTDDQTFNILLESHPELAAPAPPIRGEDSQRENPVWSKEELRELVEYAKNRDIQIMPEINVPGHTGSWSGIPGLVIPCPEFSCVKGYGIPLNISNPKLISVIQDVIREVREIFYTSPSMHLGGDEVWMSKPCFDELGVGVFNYENFELQLKGVLKKLNISENHVARWESSKQKGPDNRAGDIIHWWERSPPYNSQGTPFFASQGLYLDSCGERTAPEFYNHVQQEVLYEQPTAIIVGTFELSTHWWTDRNVLGRMLAVAMGVSEAGQRLEWSQLSYIYYCRSLGWEDSMCLSNGKPLVPQNSYIQKWKNHWNTWKATTCARLTTQKEVRIIKSSKVREQRITSQGDIEIYEGNRQFWESFGEADKSRYKPSSREPEAMSPLFRHVVNHTGVTLDLVAHQNYDMDMIINTLATLGFNLIHLKLSDDSGFALNMESMPLLGMNHEASNSKLLDTSQMIKLVQQADRKGIKVMPEINIVTRAGGWFGTDLVVKCPHTLCEKRYGIPLNFPEKMSILSVVSNIIVQLRSIFSSNFIHLGYDEWEETMDCFKEAGITPNHAEFEAKLKHLLHVQGIEPQHVLRYESTEENIKKERTGDITHYDFTTPPHITTKQFFVSTDLGYGHVDNDADAWTIYERTRDLLKSKPFGVLSKYLVINPDAWSKHGALEKVIAVAIGLSDLPKLDSKNYREKHLEACTKLKIGSCEQFGRRDSTIVSPTLLFNKASQQICDRFTSKKTIHISRKEILA